ncbi:hypothetical protein CDD83_8567 [Cordyceps sp. RAO-2017]|nr:hypothetical protein CDD83_8567 [Cordyceps sp. RAO-2017]
MAAEQPAERPASRQESPSDRSAAPKPGAKPSEKSFRGSTRRHQLRSILSQLKWDRHTVAMAIKTAIPPAVLVCAIQSDPFIHHFQTNAYLAAILSTIPPPALTRASQIQFNFWLALAIAIAYCWALLAGWSGLQARKHTTKDPSRIAEYNSSAEAVVAIFIIVWIWLVLTLKSARPSLGVQCTLAGIFSVASMPGAARAPTMPKVIAEVSVVVEAFLVGQAVGLVNALVVFPQSARRNFKKDVRACLDQLVVVMHAHRNCMEDLRLKRSSGGKGNEGSSSGSLLEEALQRFVNGVIKARGAVEPAEHEMSWGRFDWATLDHISTSLVDLIPATSGLSAMADVLQPAVEDYASANGSSGGDDDQPV